MPGEEFAAVIECQKYEQYYNKRSGDKFQHIACVRVKFGNKATRIGLGDECVAD